MRRRGQSLTEYAIIIGIVVVALSSMQAYFKRGVQAVLKTTADDLGKPAEEDYKMATGKDVSAQILGSMETGVLKYEAVSPESAFAEKEITVEEKAKEGDKIVKDTVINKDLTFFNSTTKYTTKNENYSGFSVWDAMTKKDQLDHKITEQSRAQH